MKSSSPCCLDSHSETVRIPMSSWKTRNAGRACARLGLSNGTLGNLTSTHQRKEEPSYHGAPWTRFTSKSYVGVDDHQEPLSNSLWRQSSHYQKQWLVGKKILEAFGDRVWEHKEEPHSSWFSSSLFTQDDFLIAGGERRLWLCHHPSVREWVPERQSFVEEKSAEEAVHRHGRRPSGKLSIQLKASLPLPLPLWKRSTPLTGFLRLSQSSRLILNHLPMETILFGQRRHFPVLQMTMRQLMRWFSNGHRPKSGAMLILPSA